MEKFKPDENPESKKPEKGSARQKEPETVSAERTAESSESKRPIEKVRAKQREFIEMLKAKETNIGKNLIGKSPAERLALATSSTNGVELQFLCNDSDGEVRLIACLNPQAPEDSVRRVVNDSENLPYLVTVFKAEATREQAVVFFNQFLDKQWVQGALLALTKDEEWLVRQATLPLLEKIIHLPEAQKAVVELADYDDWDVSQAAFKIIERNLEKDKQWARNAVVRLAGDGKWYVRRATLPLLEQIIHLPEAQKAVVELADDDDWDVSQAAFNIIERNLEKDKHKQWAQKAIVELAGDEDWDVRLGRVIS